MRNVKAVIGANFGDEGKGKVVNMCSKGWADLVVRFNSGSQAAHTVMHEDGFRHVFGHLGSASADGVPTYLSKFFVVNPRLFLKELDQLSFRTNGASISTVFVDKDCIVTTPYDVIINQALEMSRKNNRHGSCGVGFHETIVRNAIAIAELALTVSDIVSMDRNTLVQKLILIRDVYIKPRLSTLNIPVPKQMLDVINSDTAVSTIVDEMYMFINSVVVVNAFSVLNRFDNVVFEGAQGLLLDENHKWFPYVTHSTTGIQNVLSILNTYGVDAHTPIDRPVDSLEATYVTRSYMTRHGAGPFPTEVVGELPGFEVVDETNRPNEFQGSLRVGYLDYDLLTTTVSNDINLIGYDIGVTTTLHMTCMDQVTHKDTYHFTSGHVNDVPSLFTVPLSAVPKMFDSLFDEVVFSSSPFS